MFVRFFTYFFGVWGVIEKYLEPKALTYNAARHLDVIEAENVITVDKMVN